MTKREPEQHQHPLSCVGRALPGRHRARIQGRRDREATRDQHDRKADSGSATEMPGSETHGDDEGDRELDVEARHDVQADHSERRHEERAPPLHSRHRCTSARAP